MEKVIKFKKSGLFLDGKETFKVNFNNKDFEFSFDEYSECYICLENFNKEVKLLNRFLNENKIKTKVDVMFEKTIIIDKEEFERFLITRV